MGCIIGKNRRCKYDGTAKGYIGNKWCLNEEKDNTGIRCNEPQQKTRHPAHDDEQQQHAAAAGATAVQYATPVKNI